MFDLTKAQIYKDIISKKIDCFFVSPHLDDAVFSAGGLMSDLCNMGVPVTMLNVFTKASPKPYTLSAKKFLMNCGYDDADNLYIDRLKEDGSVAKEIGVQVVNLNFVDALWRRKDTKWIIPELNYTYPIFRLSIAKGRVSKHDSDLMLNLKQKIDDLTKKKECVLFCPIGIGHHTDHLIVRDVVGDLSKQVIYWSDYPYDKIGKVDDNFISKKHLNSYTSLIDISYKNKIVNMYKSQIKPIFGKSHADVRDNETYYL